MDDKIHVGLLSKETDRELLGYFAHLLPSDMTDVRSNWEFVAATYEDKPCGILAYILDDEIIIPWIYVDEEYRRRHIGSQMVTALKDDLEENIIFMGFSCEIVVENDGAGSDLIDFFASFGDMDIAPKYCIYEIEPSVYRETFEKHSFLRGAQKFVSLRFVDVPEYQKRELRSIPRVVDCYQIDQLKSWSENIEKDLSLCIIEDDAIASVILLTDMGEDRMSVELIYANSRESLIKLLIAFGQALIEKDNGKSLIFRPVNDRIMDLVEALFSEIMVCAEVWEASSF